MAPPTSSPSGPGIGGQALLKRRPGTSPEEFKHHYIHRHAPIALPWCLANGVTYYAQIHRPLTWSTPTFAAKYTALGINLDDWDAVAEMVFPPILSLDDYYAPKCGKRYHVEVICPDERKFLVSTALEHLQGVEPGAVTGKRVEFIVGGKTKVDCAWWTDTWEYWLDGEGEGKGY